MKRIPLTLVVILTSLCLGREVFAQASPYTLDGLQYSSSRFGGTARVQGLAGAQTALGGDISNLTGNPAGLGFYNKSTYSLSPSLNFLSSESEYLGQSNSESKVNFNFNNLGIVLANVKDDVEEGAFRGGSFGIGFTRLNNYHNEITYGGRNNENSIIDYFIEEIDASGTSIETLQDYAANDELLTPSELAYGAYLIDYYPDFGVFGSEVPLQPVRQQEKISTRGAQYQMDFAYGGNVADRFYFGGGIGIQSFRHKRERTYTEVTEGSPQVLSSLSYTDNLEVTGRGINLNVGLLYRISDYIRVGASYRSPTWSQFNETFNSSISANFVSNYQHIIGTDTTYLNNESASSLPTELSYKFRSPSRLTGGISLFAGKNGFISADVEYLNYAGAKYDFTNAGSTETQVNDEISNLLTNTINIRVGGEFRADILRFRAGFANYGSPYDKKAGVGENTQHYTLGTGVYVENFYADLGIIHSRGKQTYRPYTLFDGTGPVAEVENRATNVVLTFGSYF